MNGKVIGVLASIFENDDKLSIYTDIVKHYMSIHKMMEESSAVTTMRTPRKLANYDWIQNHTI